MLAPHGNPRGGAVHAGQDEGQHARLQLQRLKTAVLRWFEARDMAEEIAVRKALLAREFKPSIEEWLRVTPKATLDLLASFQATVIEELLRRATRRRRRSARGA